MDNTSNTSNTSNTKTHMYTCMFWYYSYRLFIPIVYNLQNLTIPQMLCCLIIHLLPLVEVLCGLAAQLSNFCEIFPLVAILKFFFAHFRECFESIRAFFLCYRITRITRIA